MRAIQTPAIILPVAAPLGPEVETVNDLVEHTSIEFPVMHLQEKQIHIVASEVITAGMPGALNCWVELSPLPSANSRYWPPPLPIRATYWAAIGGGGGALAPTAALVEAATGVPLTVHSMLIPWVQHSAWARLVIQTPVSATPLTAFWLVQAIFSAKG